MAEGFQPNEEISAIITKLWDIDENKCEPYVDYEVDLQGYVTSARHISRRDYARYNLFSWLDEDHVFNKPTYHAFRQLLDNYESETGKSEEVSPEEEEENHHFIDKIMETAVMQEAHSWLVSKELAEEDTEAFKEQLYNIWFKLYWRLREDRKLDSCGFEHVFVGETRGHEVIGFHNWIQFYLQEKRDNIDYKGYFRRGTANEDQPRLITLQFSWKKGGGKPIGSSFIGTSPEFEIAMYTICFLARDGSTKIPLQVHDYDFTVIVYPHGMGIGSAFPISDE